MRRFFLTIAYSTLSLCIATGLFLLADLADFRAASSKINGITAPAHIADSDQNASAEVDPVIVVHVDPKTRRKGDSLYCRYTLENLELTGGRILSFELFRPAYSLDYFGRWTLKERDGSPSTARLTLFARTGNSTSSYSIDHELQNLALGSLLSSEHIRYEIPHPTHASLIAEGTLSNVQLQKLHELAAKIPDYVSGIQSRGQ